VSDGEREGSIVPEKMVHALKRPEERFVEGGGSRPRNSSICTSELFRQKPTSVEVGKKGREKDLLSLGRGGKKGGRNSPVSRFSNLSRTAGHER